MWTDVVDLRDFYETHLGQVARRMIRRRLREIWPDVRGERLLGLGYATPYMRAYLDQAERVIAAMPAQQGVLHWPLDGRGKVALVEETRLPFPDLTFDKVLIVHGLEYSEALRPMLREVWRVLSESGRLIVVVPNRRGLWARFERTPFGHGRPYSASQLSRLLRDTMFTPLRSEPALYVPPSRWRVLRRGAAAWERIGARWLPPIAGVVIVEAKKEIYAANMVEARQRRRVVAPVPDPGSAPRSQRSAADRIETT
jgi:SAM-dependent methyltransferase